MAKSAAAKIEEITDILSKLTDDERAEFDEIVGASLPVWVPMPGPQQDALDSMADIVFYGGAAGGGKSDLLLGAALTEHTSSIIFRRQATQLVGIQSRLLDEILKSRQGWNGQQDILRMQDRRIEFGSCSNVGDEIKYQGRPHDFCVAEGTMVLMGDGNYRPIETIKTGDDVATLEGPCRVSLGARYRVDKAVMVSSRDNNGLICRQVQGVEHSLLTSAGWVSRDKFFEAPQPCYFSSSEGLQNFVSLFAQGSHARFQEFGISLLQDISRFSSLRWPAARAYRRSLSGIFFVARLLNQGICSAGSLYQHAENAQHLLKTFLRGHQLPALALSVPCSNQEGGSVVFDGRALASLLNFRDCCLSENHQRDAHAHRFAMDDLKGLLLQSCVGLPIPKCSANGGRGKTPTHILHRGSYDHPYTSDKRQTEAGFSESSLSFSPLSDRLKLFDITVERVNHYITSGGFVNKNCGFDEITHFNESQFRFLCGWLRTTKPGQRCRVICAGNPPTDENGRWVIQYWAPWLDDKHPNPAKPGEIRWFTTVDGKDMEVESGRPFKLNGRMVQPISRTFISSKVTDNPFLLATGYEATLQALPEPLRSQMLNADFKAGIEDSVWQVIPTKWVDMAMERWTPEGQRGEMDSCGADVARGGSDFTVVSTRYGNWYAPLKRWPGKETPNGSVTAGLIVSCLRDGAPVHVDALGVGGETIGHLESNGMQVVPVVGYDTDSCVAQTDKATGKLRFRNLRAMIWWRFREILDPETGVRVALPPDSKLKAGLCAPLWKLTPGGILIESKEEIKKRLGRSPDDGDAVVYCSMSTMKVSAMRRLPQMQDNGADIFTYGRDVRQADYNLFGRR